MEIVASVKSADYEIIYELNNSSAAKKLYDQLLLTTEVEPFSNNEMTFYPLQKLIADLGRYFKRKQYFLLQSQHGF